jgi:hypothetical protein
LRNWSRRKQFLHQITRGWEATLHHHSGKITINSVVLSGVRDDIARKVGSFTRDFVAGLDV